MANVSRTTADGRSIVTLHTVQVTEVIKGVSAPRDFVTLVVLGGRVFFSDGTFAQIDTPDFWPIRSDVSLILFGREAPNRLIAGNEDQLQQGGAFEPVAGPLGLFDLSSFRGPHVLPFGSYKTQLGQFVYKSKWTPEEFLTQVRTAIAK